MKYLQSSAIFSIKHDGKNICVIPVDGEKHYNEPSFSAGFVHFADPDTGLKLGFCGIDHFEKHATEVGVSIDYDLGWADLPDENPVTPVSSLFSEQALNELVLHFKGMLPSDDGIPQIALLLIHELRETRKALEKA